VVLADLGAVEHGVEGGDLVHADLGHLQDLGDAEIQDDGSGLARESLGEKDVAGLEIPVDDARLVGGVEAGGADGGDVARDAIGVETDKSAIRPARSISGLAISTEPTSMGILCQRGIRFERTRPIVWRMNPSGKIGSKLNRFNKALKVAKPAKKILPVTQ
jgi:hypothetical protein